VVLVGDAPARLKRRESFEVQTSGFAKDPEAFEGRSNCD
jgi:hypothetical protein